MVISAYAELMQDALAAEHPLRRNVQEIMTASRRAADLTRQLLAFSPKQMQSLQLLDLNWIIRDINKMLPPLIGEDVELAFAAGRDLGKVKADPVQIEQILMNLAANARDAMPHGGKLVIETASVQLDDAYVLDRPPWRLHPVGGHRHGPGNRAGTHCAHLRTLLHHAGRRQGNGIGPGHRVWHRNAERRLRLGVQRAWTGDNLQNLLAPGTAGDRPGAAAQIESAQGCETLFLVEGEAAVRQSTREFLVLKGYIVLEAKNGEDALRIARNFARPIDLMITDVVMGHRGGSVGARATAHESSLRLRIRREYCPAARGD
jgi:CheY-like chemotaxis protein